MPELVVTRLLAMEQDDFLRLLERILVPGETLVFDSATRSHSLSLPAGRVVIDMQPLPKRRLGSLRLPQLSISLHFCEVPSQSRESLLARLTRACHRPGG